MMTNMASTIDTRAARRRRTPFWIIILLAVLTRLGWYAATYELPAVSDENNYWLAAKTYAAGQGTAPPYWPPGTPLFGAGVVLLFGDSIAVMRLAMCPVGVVNVWLVYRTTRVILSEDAALCAMGIATFYPPWIYLSAAMLSQTLSATFVLAATWGALDIIASKRMYYAVPVGLATGLGALVRPSLLPMVAVGVFACLYLQRNRRGLVGAALVALSTAIPILPVTALNYRATGEFLLLSSNNGWNLYAGNNPDTHWYATWLLASDPKLRELSSAVASGRAAAEEGRNAVQRYEIMATLARKHILEHPAEFCIRALSRFRTFCAFDSFTPAKLHGVAPTTWGSAAIGGLLLLNAATYVAIAILAVLSIGTFAGPISRLGALVIVGMILANMVAYLMAFAHPTYHFACLGLLFILAAGPLLVLLSKRMGGAPELLARWTKTKIVLILVVLAIQVEWVLFMARRF